MVREPVARQALVERNRVEAGHLPLVGVNGLDATDDLAGAEDQDVAVEVLVEDHANHQGKCRAGFIAKAL